jgi:hypothetical protein
MISPILGQSRSLHFLGVATGSCFFHSCLAGRAGRILPVLPGVELQGSGYSFEVLTIKCESSSMVFPSHLQTNPRVFHSSMMSFGKTHVGGVKHGKTNMQFVGSMLCQLSIVVHCIPRVYVIHTFGLAGFFLHVFTRKDRPQISKFVHQGLRLNVGIMHTGSTFVLLRVSRMFVAPISFNILNLNYPLVN